jgi:hypothetical protein
MERTATNQMHMKVEDRLARFRADIQYRAIAIFDSAIAGNAGGGKVAEAYQFGFFGRGFFESGDVFFGDYKNVSWTLRVKILKREDLIIFVNFLRRHFAANNAAKKTIGHGLILTFTECRSSTAQNRLARKRKTKQ